MGRKIAPGTLVDYAGGAVGYGYLLCDGTLYDAITNPKYMPLFNRIGTTYGGTGASSFRVPDSRRRTHVGSGGTGTGMLANSVGSTGGAESHTLNSGEVPSHSHSDSGHSHSVPQVFNLDNNGNTGDSGSGFLRMTGVGGGSTGGGSASLSSFGGSGSHNNLQPSLVVTKMIKW